MLDVTGGVYRRRVDAQTRSIGLPMLRVLSIQPVAQRGGSDQALVGMLASLPTGRFECHVVVPNEPAMRRELEDAGATIHVLPMRRVTASGDLWYWLAYGLTWPVVVARLVVLIGRTRIDVVHTNSLHSWFGWAAAAITRRPHVWTAREIVVQSKAAAILERFLTRHFATVVVSMSGAVAARLDPKDGRVFLDHVDASRFRPERAGSFRGRLGISDDAVLVGAAGRIDTWKGFGVLLDAWSIVVERSPMPQLHLAVCGPAVAGKEWYERELRRRAERLPNVHWLGPCGDMPDFYADLDVFVLPSTEPEPFGLVMIEALASGVPVLATDHGGPPEVIEGFAERGRLVAPGDANALASAIEEMIDPGKNPSVPSDTARRRARPALYSSPPPPWGSLFLEVAGRS